MTIFWTLTAVLTALAGLLVLAGARRGSASLTGPQEADTDRLAGTQELAELERLKARGLLDEAAYVSARAEAGRRILASRRAEAVLSTGKRDGLWVLSGIGATAVLALGLYVAVGSPGYGDQTYSARVTEWAQNPEALEPAQMAAVMGEVVREKPQDVQALTLLGVARFEAGDPIAAASAFRRALSQNPEDAQNWARLGESLVRANEGSIGPDAEAAFVEAIKRDGEQFGARYFLGEVALSRGDVKAAEAMWAPIIAVLGPADPRLGEMQRLLADARSKAAS